MLCLDSNIPSSIYHASIGLGILWLARTTSDTLIILSNCLLKGIWEESIKNRSIISMLNEISKKLNNASKVFADKFFFFFHCLELGLGLYIFVCSIIYFLFYIFISLYVDLDVTITIVLLLVTCTFSCLYVLTFFAIIPHFLETNTPYMCISLDHFFIAYLFMDTYICINFQDSLQNLVWYLKSSKIIPESVSILVNGKTYQFKTNHCFSKLRKSMIVF